MKKKIVFAAAATALGIAAFAGVMNLKAPHTANSEVWANALWNMSSDSTKLYCDAKATRCVTLHSTQRDSIAIYAIENGDERLVCLREWKSGERACWNPDTLQRTDETLDAAGAWEINRVQAFADDHALMASFTQYYRWQYQKLDGLSWDALLDKEIPLGSHFDSEVKKFTDEAVAPRKFAAPAAK
ncbi:hypothetical protein [Rhodoblastus sp.]|uniref:hypothetical protein n=1 Tax=Rhodoblastus sp. TaxID=1962975 RepID=UPI0026092071|nr:hypothetical protein [Rhodoblastus sp.]